jgi:NitT/TauT family transport system substrate-binding protein
MLMPLFLLQAALTIAVGGAPTATEYLPLTVAHAEERFAREGLSVTLRHGKGEVSAAEALANGNVDLAATTLDAALRHGAFQGKPPKLVFVFTAIPPVALVIANQSRSAIRRIEELAGKIVGVPAVGSSEAHLLFGLLARHHLSPAQVRVISLGDRGLAQSLERGEIQAGVLAEPWVSRLLATGRFALLTDLRERRAAQAALGGPTVHAALFIRHDRATSEHASLVPFLRALLRSGQSIAERSPEELAARLPSNVAHPREEFLPRLVALKGVLLSDGVASEEAIKQSLQLLTGAPPFPSAVKLPRQLSELLFLDPLRQALQDVKRDQ